MQDKTANCKCMDVDAIKSTSQLRFVVNSVSLYRCRVTERRLLSVFTQQCVFDKNFLSLSRFRQAYHGIHNRRAESMLKFFFQRIRTTVFFSFQLTDTGGDVYHNARQAVIILVLTKLIFAVFDV